MVVLESNSYSPFDTWSDWYNDERSVLVTFKNINKSLLNNWIINENTNSVEVNNIGIKRRTDFDDDGKIDVVYDVNFVGHTLSKDKCLKAINRINNKYNEDLQLNIKQDQVVSENQGFELYTYVTDSIRVTTADKVIFNEFFEQNIEDDNYNKNKLYIDDVISNTVYLNSTYTLGVNIEEDVVTVVYPSSYVDESNSKKYAKYIKENTEYSIEPDLLVNCDITEDVFSINSMIN